MSAALGLTLVGGTQPCDGNFRDLMADPTEGAKVR